MILFGEGYVNVKLFACAVADHLLLEAGDKLAGTELKGVVFSSAAVKSNIVNIACKIKNSGIAVLSSTILNVDYSCVTLTDTVKFLVNILVGNGNSLALNLDALVFAELYFGLNGDNGGENETIFADGNDVEINIIINILKTAFLDGSVKSFGIKSVYSVLIEELLAVHTLDDVAGSLALTETGNVELSDILAVSSSAGLLKGFSVNCDFQLSAVGFGCGAGFKTHNNYPPNRNNKLNYVLAISKLL